MLIKAVEEFKKPYIILVINASWHCHHYSIFWYYNIPEVDVCVCVCELVV